MRERGRRTREREVREKKRRKRSRKRKERENHLQTNLEIIYKLGDIQILRGEKRGERETFQQSPDRC